MISEIRRARLVEVADQRMRWVRCAAEHVFHRHNVSALLRTCDALGLQDVHLIGDRSFDPVRGASMGVARWLRLHTHFSHLEAVERLKSDGYQLWVADLADPPTPPELIPVDRPVCLWFGAELAGVHPEVRARADGVVTLPMRGFAQSLNLSVAGALCLASVAERARAQHGAAALLDPHDRDALLAGWLEREQRTTEAEATRQRSLGELGADPADEG